MKGNTGQSKVSYLEYVVLGSLIGLFLLVAVPNYNQKWIQSEAFDLADDFRNYGSAFLHHHQEFGAWPPDQRVGEVPLGMEGYLPGFTDESIVGGEWDWMVDSDGMNAGICLIESSPNIHVYEHLDEMIDNGDLETGSVFLDGNRLVLLLE